MKLLLLGKNGQVGWELQRALQPLGQVCALDRHTDDATGFCGDVTDFNAIEFTIKNFQPDIIINATAYTAVDQAEVEIDQADLVNHLAVKNLADLARKFNVLLIHYSTDYVFSGHGLTAWQEDDVSNPINSYGKTKRDGEIALQQSQARYLNFRTSWVYGVHGNNFIKTMLKLAQSKDELNIIDDQRGVPTGAALIADITAQVIRYYVLHKDQQNHLHGHYHLAAQGETSWCDYAKFIFQIAKSKNIELKIKHVNPIKTVAYPTPAQRPLNSRLDTSKLQQNFQIHLPQWQQGVEHVLGELLK